MSSATTTSERKRIGAWYTPAELVALVVEHSVSGFSAPTDRPVRVVDTACGDGRFLVAVADRLRASGHEVELTGCDVDPAATRAAAQHDVRVIEADALSHAWEFGTYDLVVGNPPFLSQLAAATTRGGASRHGGGPYADAAVEFLALATALARPDGGRVGLVLPQSILGARDAAPVRETVAERSDLTWSWWEADQDHFDASVNVCALGFQRPATNVASPASWTRVVTDRLGVPPLDLSRLAADGTIGERALLNANFRDEYYALVPAVSDEADGPPLITSGLIDPGRCHWGERRVRFAKRDYQHPRVDLRLLEGRFVDWAARKLVPKVLIANQTRIVEAVADPDGSWLPGVPVTTATPTAGADVWQIAAVLTSPIASIAAWQHGAGTGLSTSSVRIGPTSLAATPWPARSDDLHAAVLALRDGRIVECGQFVAGAYGLSPVEAEPLVTWWAARF